MRRWLFPLIAFLLSVVNAVAQAPPQAAALGYNTLTFGPNLTVSTHTGSAGYPDFTDGNVAPYAWDGTAWRSIGFTQNGDGSVSMDGSGQTFGNGLTTGDPSLPFSSTAYTEADRLTFAGRAFGGGGYFEAVMKSTCGGNMAFWMNDVEGMNGGSIGIGNNPWGAGQPHNYANFNEIDMAEFDIAQTNGCAGALPQGQYAGHWENWYGVSPGNPQTDLGPTSPQNNFGWFDQEQSVTGKPQPDYSQYHTYGFLWVPATNTSQGYAEYYFDNVKVSNRIFWNKYDPALGPPPVNGTTAGSRIDVTHPVLFLGGGNGTGHGVTTFKSVSIWQASGANNIPAVTPSCPASADRSTLTGGSTSVLTDNLGHGWGIPINQGNVFLQGTSLPATSKAVQLAYVGGVIWYQNSSLQWFSLTPSGAIASGPQSGSPLGNAETITIANIPTQTAAAPFTVSGTIANATSVLTLQYSVNGKGYQPLPTGSTVTLTSFTFTMPALTANTSNTISVRDAAQTTVVAFSNAFAVNGSGGNLSGTPMSPLPGGYLHTAGNQILDGSGNNIRMACSGYGSPTGNYNSDMSLMRNQGFNCARYDIIDATTCPSVLSGSVYVPGTCNFSTLDQIVSAATSNNMKVVFDMHGSDSNCGGSQPNGLWYDLNSSTQVAGVTWNALKTNGDGCSTNTGSGNFSISGGFIHDPTGAKFVPVGVNIYSEQIPDVLQNASGYPVANLFPGINYIRVMVCAGADCSQNGWNGSTNGQPTSINYPNPANFLQIASFCQSAKIVCNFEDHTSNGSYWEFSNLAVGRSQSSSPIPGSSLMNSVNSFWSAMAAQFKNNPYAWIGTFNELGIGGQAYATSVFHQYSYYHQSLYNAIRATGNNNIIELCGGNGCSDRGTMGPNALDPSVYPAMHNVIWLIHSYQDGSSANVAAVQANLAGTTQTGVYGPGCEGYVCQQQITSGDGVMPVIFDEVGMATGGSNTTNGQAIALALTNIQSLGIGAGGFVFYNPNCSNAQQTNSNCYGMVNNGGQAGLPVGGGGYTLINPWAGYVAGMIAANPFKGGNGGGGGGGGGTQPTKTYSTFKADMAAIASHYSGNATVIGFDLWNAPTINSTFQNPTVNWGGNNGADARLMCNDVGSVVESSDPGALVICEGPINPGSTFLNGTAFQANFHNFADLTLAPSTPVTLTGDTGSHVVYGVEDLPSFGQNPPWLDSGAAKITMMNTSWGGIVKQNTAPVWISAMGASLDGSDGFLSDEQAWASTLSTYMNGGAGSSGGPTFTGCQQPIGGDWLTFGNGSGTINGTLNANNTNKAGQYAVYSMLLYTTCSTNTGPGAGATTWNPNDKIGVTLSADLLTASGTGFHQGVRSTTSLSAGKVCGEANPTTISANWTFGIANSSMPLDLGAGLGTDANGIGMDPNTGSGQLIQYNNTALSSGASHSVSNEKQTVCVDLGAKLFWITNATQRGAGNTWNNSPTADPASGTGGLSFAGLTCPCFLTFTTDEAPSVAVLNAPGPFAVSIPTGFSAWQLPVTMGNHPIFINLGN